MIGKLTTLRQHLKRHGLKSYLEFKTDEHFSEYLSPADERIEAFSHFKSSNITLWASQNDAVLYTDPRYAGLSVPDFKVVIVDKFTNNTQITKEDFPIGYCSKYVDQKRLDIIREKYQLKECDSLLELVLNELGTPLPKPTLTEVFVFDDGIPVEHKLAQIYSAMDKEGLDQFLISRLDHVCYVLNLRAQDYVFTPMFKSFLLVERKTSTLFTDNPMSQEAKEHLRKLGTAVRDYSSFWAVREATRVTGVQPPVSSKIWSMFQNRKEVSIVTNLIKYKTKAQLQNYRLSCLYDGIALTEFFSSIEHDLKSGKAISEYEAAVRINALRSTMPKFVKPSFETISASGPNSAIIHYSPKSEGSAALSLSEMYLLDSGGQYLTGTTDITRTVHFGTPSEFEKEIYTRVLVGNLRLERQKWTTNQRPEGKRLDQLAHSKLKEKEYTYRHGTGHGVGYFLNVHEGPTGISPLSTIKFQENMLVTNEPGCYFLDKFGVRIENILAVQSLGEEVEGFANLSLFPYCTRLIDQSLLEPEDVLQINEYHKRCILQLSGRLSTRAMEWLVRQTRELT